MPLGLWREEVASRTGDDLELTLEEAPVHETKGLMS